VSNDESRCPSATLLMAAMLLLPPLYVGSYIAMVTPNSGAGAPPFYGNYRFGEVYASRIYWPLQQADRQLFPERWMERAIIY
jgi:hypothetical protein